MQKEIIEFIKERGLDPFSKEKSSLRMQTAGMFKTADAKTVYNKVITYVSNNFCFKETDNIWNLFPSTNDEKEIMKRQEFFRGLNVADGAFLKNLKVPRETWKPEYRSVVVTEDEKTLSKLKEMEIPCRFIVSDYDIEMLGDYDVVQMIDCETYGNRLLGMHNVTEINTVDEAYLERYLEELSAWKDNIAVMGGFGSERMREISEKMKEMMGFIENVGVMIKSEDVEAKLTDMNKDLLEKIKGLTISGDSLFMILSGSSLPIEIKKVISDKIKESGFPEDIFLSSVPIKIDEEALDKHVKKQSAKKYGSFSERLTSRAGEIRNIPGMIEDLKAELLFFDFSFGVCEYIKECNSWPEISNELKIADSYNLFLNNAKAISFSLNDEYRCSILTGANSGGKTTLLEHVIQLFTLTELGLPTKGLVKMPAFSEVYYFAKNKGSVSKGAFETLLTQLASIKSNKDCLILADEIESVTEPGVAGRVVCASAEFFIQRYGYLIIATHLGHEIKNYLPVRARIDGIEAKGLDENFELIVDHNPVLGKLANSTPELIIERMANTSQEEYFDYLFGYLKDRKN